MADYVNYLSTSGVNYISPSSGPVSGVTYSDPGILTGTSLGNFVNSLAGIPDQDAAGNYLRSDGSPVNSPVGSISTAPSASASIASVLQGFENALPSGLTRIAIVILGFIFIAVALKDFTK